MADSPAHSDYDEVMCLPCVTEITHEWDHVVCLPCAAAGPQGRKSVIFGQTEIFPCPKDPNAWKIPDRSHDTKSYSHSIRIKSMCKKREGRRAHIKATLLHKQVLLNNDDLPDLDAPELGRRRGSLQHLQPAPINSAVSHLESIARKWHIDAGCPIDLISSDDLTEEEKKYMKRLVSSVKLHTANGVARTENVPS